MAPMERRRRGGAWRCPDCGGIFIDMGTRRRGRGARPPALVPVLSSVAWSLLALAIVRRLRRRKDNKSKTEERS
jgi:ssDNA-binding Zn-finger/Zn-ribbon topoisomerase 1